MKRRNRNFIAPSSTISLACSAAVICVGWVTPAIGQSDSAHLEEVIVSARRQQESLQEIPISITVVDQNELTNSNVFGSADLKQFTPSLAVDRRFGDDQASFAIRGFTQELRTTASVGVYFAEVVAPRGGGNLTAGDGAGPGSFFDLQNVLVLKGPQGTLFGRNTTGGAILLTPQEPTNELGGYLEVSAGDYDMQRIQGVLNLPISDTLRSRFGVDTMQRDGHLNNRSGVGPSELANVDYLALRASVVWDASDTVENYTILSYVDSDNKGVVHSLFACSSGLSLFNQGCAQQLAHQGDDIYSVESLMKNPSNSLEQWQVINTTTWAINDDITLKNILSYADLEQTNRTSVFGINYGYFDVGRYGYTESNQYPGIPTNSQISLVEELQLQGYAMEGSLTWQTGLYFENSKPDGISGSQSVNQLYCSSVDYQNPEASTCVDAVRSYYFQTFGFDALGLAFPDGYGAFSRSLGEIEYTTKAVYSEATYDLRDDVKITGGLRYTEDKVEGMAQAEVWGGYPFASPPGTPATPGVATTHQCYYANTSLAEGCKDRLETDSEAVTGVVDVDYYLTQDVMMYAKYSRGYRMGSVGIFAGEGFRTFDPEQVDAYEIGAKTSFGGPVPGTFNASVFYNELQDQQIQYGFLKGGLPPTTVIVNAGESVIQGLELETTLLLLESLQLSVSYTYLDTELKSLIDVASSDPTAQIFPSSLPGGDLTFSPKHSVVANLQYHLPLPVEIGDVSLGATYTYTGEQYSSSPEFVTSAGNLSGSPYSLLDSYEIVNLNANWLSVFGSNFDIGLFMTNALDEEYTTYVTGTYNSLGIEQRQVGVPKMWGARIRYNFGQ